ncbi:MAG: hypothetical protein HYX53_14220 [Chloroflexi bacterium]|nr:hypothetical protein [Chloroflexota bacterium]
MLLMSRTDLLLIASSALLWLVVMFGVLLLLVLLRIVGSIQLAHSGEVRAERLSARPQVGALIPAFSAVNLSTREPIIRATLLGNPTLLIVVTPGCSACDNAVAWAQASLQDRTIVLISAPLEQSSRAARIWGERQHLAYCAAEDIDQTLSVPSTPFAIRLDEIGTITAAQPIVDRDDWDSLMTASAVQRTLWGGPDTVNGESLAKTQP